MDSFSEPGAANLHGDVGRHRQLRLRTRLGLLVLALAAPFLIFTVVSSVRETQIESDQAAAQMLGTARVTAARLDDHVNDIRQLLQVLTVLVSVQSEDTASNDRLLRSLTDKLPKHVNNVTVWNLAGENIGAIDSRVRKPDGTVAARKFFRDAVAGSALAVEAPVVSISNGALIGIFSVPVVREGRTLAVVAVSMRLSQLQSLLASDGMTEGSVITVTDVSGVVLARSIHPETWIGRNLKAMAAGGVASALVQREGTRIGPGVDGIDRVAGYTTARVAPWLVYVGVPTETALAAAHAHLRLNLLIAGTMLLAGLGLAYFIGEGIARPLRQLSVEALGLGNDTLHQGIQTRATGEVGVLADTLDRMARRLHEQSTALQASREQLRKVTDNVPALISYIDGERRFRFANHAYQQWLGIDPDSLIGKTLPELYGEATYDTFRIHIDRALGGDRVSYERELTTPDGLRQVEVTAVPDRAPDGSVRGIYVMMSDVSADRAAKAALAASEHRLQMIADNIPALVTYIDHEERFRFVNSTAEATFGVTSAELIGKTIRDSRGATLHDSLQPHIAQVLRGNRADFEVTLQIHGRTVHHQSSYVPDRDDQGRVRGYYSMTFDITALKETQRQLDLLARRDTLTGLPNRRAFTEHLDAAMARCRRGRDPMALVFLDIDHFKAINDEHGHGIGDAVLKEFAGRLHQSVRITDTVARLAGDEFVIVLEGLHGDGEADALSRKIGEAIRRPMHCEGKTLHVTASLGYALYDGLGGNAEALTAKADGALYRAKAAGRDTYAATNFVELA